MVSTSFLFFLFSSTNNKFFFSSFFANKTHLLHITHRLLDLASYLLRLTAASTCNNRPLAISHLRKYMVREMVRELLSSSVASHSILSWMGDNITSYWKPSCYHFSAFFSTVSWHFLAIWREISVHFISLVIQVERIKSSHQACSHKKFLSSLHKFCVHASTVYGIGRVRQVSDNINEPFLQPTVNRKYAKLFCCVVSISTSRQQNLRVISISTSQQQIYKCLHLSRQDLKLFLQASLNMLGKDLVLENDLMTKHKTGGI